MYLGWGAGRARGGVVGVGGGKGRYEGEGGGGRGGTGQARRRGEMQHANGCKIAERMLWIEDVVDLYGP